MIFHIWKSSIQPLEKLHFLAPKLTATCKSYFDIKSGFSFAPAFSLHKNFDVASVSYWVN